MRLKYKNIYGIRNGGGRHVQQQLE